MAGILQYEEIPESSADKSGHPIYDAARLCSEHFADRLERADGARDDYLAVEELWGTFKQWARYAGAFAMPRASLDARLSPYADIRDMVLELLDMLQENLSWGNVVSYSMRSGKRTDMSTVNGDNAEKPAEWSPGLPAASAAVKRLLVLSKDLRHSSLRETTFRRESRSTTEEAESSCHSRIQKKYPNCRESLRSQLSASVHERGISLQYMQSYNKKLIYPRDDQYQSDGLDYLEDKPQEQAETPVVYVIKNITSKKQIVALGPDTVPPVAPSSAIARINQMKWEPSGSVISSGSVVREDQGLVENYPPRPKQRAGGEYISCTICAMPLNPQTLTNPAW